MTNKQKGRIGLALAISYFTLKDYTISIPMNDTQWYDLIIEKDGKFETVQCKCTDGNSIALRSMGGTKGIAYDNVLNHNTDYLFCVDGNKNKFLIPVNEIRKSGNINSITLRTEKSISNQGFESYKYLVQF